MSTELLANTSQSYRASPVIWDHSVTRHGTQVYVSYLTPSRQAGTLLTNLGGMKGWVGPGCWLYTKIGLPVLRQLPIQVITTNKRLAQWHFIKAHNSFLCNLTCYLALLDCSALVLVSVSITSFIRCPALSLNFIRTNTSSNQLVSMHAQWSSNQDQMQPLYNHHGNT